MVTDTQDTNTDKVGATASGQTCRSTDNRLCGPPAPDAGTDVGVGTKPKPIPSVPTDATTDTAKGTGNSIFYPISVVDVQMISSRFRTKRRPRHDGIDIAAPGGTAVRSPWAGSVVECGWQNANNDKEGWGYYVKIKYEKTGITAIFAHLKEAAVGLAVGQNVEMGQKIGEVGNTGDVEPKLPGRGYHLHYEERYPNNAVREPAEVNDLYPE